MRYYIVAGEPSGDLHASNLIKSIKAFDKDAVIRGCGGDLMQKEGCDLVLHYREMAFMGIIEVVLNLNKIFKNLKICKADILEFKPDCVILIDYPGFNFKIAKFSKEHSFKTFYYIAPKIWAWKQGRVKRIKKYVDKVYSILPFEKDFYAKHNCAVDYVGNPILDSIEGRSDKGQTRDAFLKINNLPDKPIVAILPGSRKQEIEHLLSIICQSVSDFTEFQFVIAGMTVLDKSLYAKHMHNMENISIVYDQTYQLLQQSQCGIIASGTASLETALFKVPHVVVYKMIGGWLANFLWKNVISVKYASLVNLINDKETVKELIQSDFNPVKLKEEISKLLYDKEFVDKIHVGYKELDAKMGQAGASSRTASFIFNELKNNI